MCFLSVLLACFLPLRFELEEEVEEELVEFEERYLCAYNEATASTGTDIATAHPAALEELFVFESILGLGGVLPSPLTKSKKWDR